jgi:prepilin-type N-terminal cleavage/methylation domain-containing protein
VSIEHATVRCGSRAHVAAKPTLRVPTELCVPVKLRSRPAFTLVELIVAAVVGAMVAGAVAVSAGQLWRTNLAASQRQQASARAEAAASRISLDLLSAARDSDLLSARVSILDSGTGPSARDELLILTKSMRPVRGEAGEAEGDLQEAQYRVVGTAGGAGSLWGRRDPAMDEIVDGGGIAESLVEGVMSVSITAYDGEAWFEEWDSDRDGMPHAVRISVEAAGDDGKTRATSRRLVAIDRVPIPVVEEEETETEPGGVPADPGTSGPTTSGGGTGGGGGGAGGGPGGGGPRPPGGPPPGGGGAGRPGGPPPGGGGGGPPGGGGGGGQGGGGQGGGGGGQGGGGGGGGGGRPGGGG